MPPPTPAPPLTSTPPPPRPCDCAPSLLPDHLERPCSRPGGRHPLYPSTVQSHSHKASLRLECGGVGHCRGRDNGLDDRELGIGAVSHSHVGGAQGATAGPDWAEETGGA